MRDVPDTADRRPVEGAAVLEVRGVSKAFPGVRALQAVDLDVRAGEVMALVGENGAGKSTLIKILAGAQEPDEGQILIDGAEVRLASPNDSVRRGISTVYQEFNLFRALTVAENIVFGQLPMRFGVIDWAAARATASEVLDRLGVDIDPSRRVAQLSVAEQQMVEIAKALVSDVRILILDEPTAVLGGHDVEPLFDTVDRLRRAGVGVIFVSHRLDEVFGLADRYAVLKDGQLAGSGEVSGVDHDALVAMMVGREVLHERRPSARRPGDVPLLRVEHLTREGAFEDVSFHVDAGEVVGLAGLRGAGRTEVARAIFGADPVDGGQVLIKGSPVEVHAPGDAIRLGLGLVPEERKTQGLIVDLPAPPNVSLVLHAVSSTTLARPRDELRTARRYVEQLRIRIPRLDRPTRELSGGNQQKVVLAKWLEAGVSILILDEPTRGIDIGAKGEVYDTIRALCEQGMGVVLISSELPEVLTLSDRILVMCQGRIAAELDGDTATEETVMAAAVGGAA